MGDEFGVSAYGNDPNLQKSVASGIEVARVQLDRLEIPFPDLDVVNDTVGRVIIGANDMVNALSLDTEFSPLFVEMSIDQLLVEQAVRGATGSAPLPEVYIVDSLGDILRRLTRWFPSASGQANGE